MNNIKEHIYQFYPEKCEFDSEQYKNSSEYKTYLKVIKDNKKRETLRTLVLEMLQLVFKKNCIIYREPGEIEPHSVHYTILLHENQPLLDDDEELVLFYTKVCNGCKMVDGFALFPMKDWRYDVQNLKKEFPFETYWIWEDDYDEEKIKQIGNGTIELIDIGDGQSWNLIINGKEAGNMWFFTDVGLQPAAPSMSFLEWFEFWLDGKEDYFYEFGY